MKKLDIRLLVYSRNEMKMLPLKKKWCDYHGLKMVYFDNESTDGSREWAIEEGVFHEDIITNGEFDIVKTMAALENYRKTHEYDYSIVAGVDLFLSGIGDKTLSQCITEFDKEGYDGLMCSYVMLCRNDSVSTLDFRHYTRGLYHEEKMMLIAKSDRKLGIDRIYAKKPLLDTGLWWFNCGNTKSVEERKETYERRKKAWDRGMKKAYGVHYQDLVNYNFTMPNIVTQNIYEIGAKEPLFELCDLLDSLES
jgi:hypothetical protein